MADFGALSKLTKKADAVATSASVLVSRSIRDIRGEISNLSRELNLAGSAEDRDKAYQMVRAKMIRLGRQLNRLMMAQNELAAKTAAQSASKMTGLEIKYSAKRAQAVCEMVTPAQGENLAAVFTDKMGAKIIGSLREATVAALREQAVAGGSLKETAAAMRDKWFEAVKDGVPRFVDSSGHEWNTATYFQMNVRTNSMRVYNDCLIDDVARETGSDVMRISTGGSDPNCECAAWEGTLISLTGKTPGLPTYDDAKAGGCFHPNCVHTLEVVDEYADADEIKRAQAHPFDKPDDDADIWEVQDNRKYEIDQAVKMDEQGMTQDEARVAVDRDNLAASIRAGLIRGDAEDLVAKMTDAQVTALCPDGNPPEFTPFKPTKAELADGAKEKWNHGKWGGVVHIDAKATAEDILKVCKVDEKADKPEPKKDEPKIETGSVQWYEKKLADIPAKDEAEAVEILKSDFGLKQVDTGRQNYRMARVTDKKTREDTAKMVCVALADLKQRFPNANIVLEELNMRRASRSAAACATLDHQRGWKVCAMDIAFDPSYATKDWSARIEYAKLNNGVKWTQGHEDIRMNFDNFRHEFGHILTTKDVQAEFEPIRDALGPRKYFKEHVSNYAATNCVEAIAETFATITSHDYVPGTLDRRLEDFVYYTMLKVPKKP